MATPVSVVLTSSNQNLQHFVKPAQVAPHNICFSFLVIWSFKYLCHYLRKKVDLIFAST